MIYLVLFAEFLKIGMFSFGGAYGAIPLIRQSVLENGWMSEAMFANIIAVSESTPGPIMVNAATYVGSSQAGVLGAAAATLGVILPSFVIILLVAVMLSKFIKNKAVQAVLRGIKPCLTGVIFATGFYMVCEMIIGSSAKRSFDLTALIIFAILAILPLTCKKLFKREFSPIALICTAAVLGGVMYSL